mmetsp:Transcript_77395/g.239673  ORF Transcript_77395/g.239673 Transcript_77395/m.239673 type:complete len:206 (+) Transcript_77395:382-999(+)
MTGCSRNARPSSASLPAHWSDLSPRRTRARLRSAPSARSTQPTSRLFSRCSAPVIRTTFGASSRTRSKSRTSSTSNWCLTRLCSVERSSLYGSCTTAIPTAARSTRSRRASRTCSPRASSATECAPSSRHSCLPTRCHGGSGSWGPRASSSRPASCRLSRTCARAARRRGRRRWRASWRASCGGVGNARVSPFSSATLYQRSSRR